MSNLLDESLPPVPPRCRKKPEMETKLPIGTKRKQVIRLDTVGLSRNFNDYVDTPNLPTVHRPSKRGQDSLINKNNNINENRERERQRCVIEQPVSVTQLPIDIKGAKSSIICMHCRKCKCRQCTERRPLPSLNLCCTNATCNAQDVIEKVSCVCCLKGVAYHCCYDENKTAFEEPCAGCTQPNCALRWACLGVLSTCIPCLCLYWPMRGVTEAITSCYNCCCVTKGCQCKEPHTDRDKTKFIYSSEHDSSSSFV